MSGHGWVTPLPSGAKARCGGPGICPECQREQAELAGAFKLRRRTDEEREAYFVTKLAELVNATKQRDHLRAALQRLVDAKDEKDANGDTPRYRELKAGAWEEAREVLLRVPRSE